AQGKRSDRDHRVPWRLQQHPRAVANVLPQTPKHKTSILRLCSHAVFNDATIKQMDSAICVLSETLVVRNHANRGATLMQFAEQLHDSFAVVRIEVTGRLVGKQNRWSAGKRASNCDALLLAARELTRQVFCPMRHTHALQ